MEQVYHILKSFVDPVFIIFVFLLISFLLSLAGAKKRSGALFLLLTIIMFYGFSIKAVSNFFSYKQEKEYIVSGPAEENKQLDVIVALGGGVYEINALGKTYSSGATVLRLTHALRMYKQHDAKYLVCCGAGHNGLSNAEVMAQMAQEFGVPKERIRIEAKSTNTYEHALELNRMFVDKKIKIGLVTSACHMKRSEAQFRKFFSSVTPLPADYLYASPAGTPVLRFIPQSQPLLDNTLIFRERIGMIWYAIKDI
jgi:uncharacterized SAM-binding protein YcdF (DUF218 family)